MKKQYDIFCEGGGGATLKQIEPEEKIYYKVPEPRTWLGKLWKYIIVQISVCPPPDYIEITDPTKLAQIKNAH